MVQPKRSSYHHGDARNALLGAAATLLEEVGAQRLSLRQVASHAGLSRQAPYNHFADKEALLAELVRGGFERLAADIRGITGYPRAAAALQCAAEAYIGFAQREPGLFRLMFSCELVDAARFPDVAAAGAAAYQSLVQIVAARVAPARCEDLSLAAWAIVHGYAMLCLETGLEDGSCRAQRARLFARLIDAGERDFSQHADAQ